MACLDIEFLLGSAPCDGILAPSIYGTMETKQSANYTYAQKDQRRERVLYHINYWNTMHILKMLQFHTIISRQRSALFASQNYGWQIIDRQACFKSKRMNKKNEKQQEVKVCNVWSSICVLNVGKIARPNQPIDQPFHIHISTAKSAFMTAIRSFFSVSRFIFIVSFCVYKLNCTWKIDYVFNVYTPDANVWDLKRCWKCRTAKSWEQISSPAEE